MLFIKAFQNTMYVFSFGYIGISLFHGVLDDGAMIDDDITRGLKNKDVAERRRMAALLWDQTAFDWASERSDRDISRYIPALAEVLYDEDEEIRKIAMSAIFAAQHDGQDVKAAIPAMLAALETGVESGLKKNAVIFLRNEVEKGFDLSPYISFFKHLLAPSGQDDITLGAADTLALYYIKNKDWKSVDALLSHENVEVRQETVGTIDHYYAKGIPQSTIEIIVGLLSDPDDELPLVAAMALAPLARGMKDIERVGNVFLVHARSTDAKHSKTAISGISRLVERAVSCKDGLPRAEWKPLAPLLDFLKDLLQHADKKLNEIAAKVLTKYYTHAGDWEEVNRLLHDANPEIRAASLDHLCRCSIRGCNIDASPAIPAIVDLLPGDQDTLRIVSNLVRNKNLQVSVLDAAIRSAKLSVDEAWPYLEITSRALGNIDWNQHNAKKELDSLSKGKKLSYILNIARTRQGEARRWAIHEIYNLHTFDHVSIRRAMPDLVHFLSDEDPFIRAEAATAIGHMTSHYDTSAALPHLARLLADPASKIQECAAMALAAMANKGIDISETLDALASMLLRSAKQETRGQAAIAFYNLAEKGKD
ncbi:MAG: HEAT repeat domain-containing protein, partial [Candidatus Sigynarchaeota archaeon]